MSLAHAPEPAAGRRHVAHFYGRDEELVERAAGFLLGGLGQGAGAVVVADDAHRRAIAAALGPVPSRGAPGAPGCVVVDATRTMQRFIAGGEVDHDGFEHVVSGLVGRAAPGGERVRAYVEMVGQLWRAGDVNAAIELERLWDELSDRLGVDVFCGYPGDGVDVAGQLDAVLEVCALHDATYGDRAPVPTSEGPAFVSAVLPASFWAPAAARRFVAAAARRLGGADVAEDAALVATELATNAVVHARSSFNVEVARTDGAVRVTVTDHRPELPVPRPAARNATTGRGLRIVAAVADKWGTRSAGTGKSVWAVLRRRPGHNS
jgi:anti-sigma regulatory factor (Ser/Thr protein kinase)